jgi:hypothetical protein
MRLAVAAHAARPHDGRRAHHSWNTGKTDIVAANFKILNTNTFVNI